MPWYKSLNACLKKQKHGQKKRPSSTPLKAVSGIPLSSSSALHFLEFSRSSFRRRPS